MAAPTSASAITTEREPLAPIETAVRAAWLALLYTHAVDGGRAPDDAFAAARAAEHEVYARRVRFVAAPPDGGPPQWCYDATGLTLFETDGPDAHARAAAEAYARHLHRIAAVLRDGLLPVDARSADSWRGGSWVASVLDEHAAARTRGQPHAAWLTEFAAANDALAVALGGSTLQGAVVDVSAPPPPTAPSAAAAPADADAVIYPCPRCKSVKEIEMQQKQRRSLDEPADVLLKCGTCKHRWALRGL